MEDDPKSRDRIVNYLRGVESAEDMDLIIALGMAKEGFDWPFCEHALTVGYRGSLTEIIQIIGRATRDSEGKHHAQFTNLIAQPDAEDDQVKASVNNMLKAITASLAHGAGPGAQLVLQDQAVGRRHRTTSRAP